MPKAQVDIAKTWPEPWYFVPSRTSSQWTPTPKTIMSAVPRNSAMIICMAIPSEASMRGIDLKLPHGVRERPSLA